jgi:hypothetical protein
MSSLDSAQDKSVVVLTWKPEINPDFKEADFDALATQCWKQGFVDVNWRFLSDRFQPKDPVIVVRQGREAGLVAIGFLLSSVEKKTGTPEHLGVGLIRLTKMRDSHEHQLISKRELLEMGFRKVVLETQASGSLCLAPEEEDVLRAALLSKLSIKLGGD